MLEKVEVEYVTLPGWEADISKCRQWNDLPENARKYVEFIEQYLGVPVTSIGVGAGRSDMVLKEKN